MRSKLLSLYWLLTGLLLSLLIAGTPFISIANTPPVTSASIPTVEYQGAQIPDTQNLSFSVLPPFDQSGSVQFPEDLKSNLKYNPDRTWNQGDSPKSVLRMGDFGDSFGLQDLTFAAIASAVGFDSEEVTLDRFEPFKLQNLESLTKADPDLLPLPVKTVKPVNDLLKSVAGLDINKTIGQVLQESPILGKLEFSTLPSLQPYKFSDVPNLSSTPIGAFDQWQGVVLDKIQGLPDLSWSKTPAPLQAVGNDVGSVDIAFEYKEQKRYRSISGGDRAPQQFNTPCEENCASFEVAGSPKVLGTYWISGKPPAPWVPGGYGPLGQTAGTQGPGKEPHGRFPYGPGNTGPFKVVVINTAEKEGTVDFGFYTNFCIHSPVDLGCTPYIFGPIPFLKGVAEKTPVFLGSVTTPTINNPDVSAISSTSSSQASSQTSSSSSSSGGGTNTASNPALPASLSFLQSQGSLSCSNQQNGVLLDALFSAISSIEGDYSSVGPFVCDSGGNCGRGLGAIQYMSYRQDVRNQISSKSGGNNFLSELDSGKQVSDAEVLTFFPVADQEALFDTDSKNLINIALSEIDPTTGQVFTGDRLIQRVGQMQFGGTSIPIDSNVSDGNGKFSVKSYGENIANSYQQSVGAMGC